ncbi:MAG: dimethylamine monooxygenase subunit DmmA family protein [Steroidobacterales bacterium]
MLITGIKSKPVYAPLRADTGGRYHLMLGSGVGREPLRRVLAELHAEQADALSSTRVLYVPDSADTTGAAAHFDVPGLAAVRLFDGSRALLEAFRTTLDQSLMGARLYVAGPESFIGTVMQLALGFNLNKDEIRAEECGTLARRVRCIHCRATTEDVKTNIVQCVGCGLWLLVRDHYSRRLAAYMGVMADAEAPGELPAIKEVFL